MTRVIAIVPARGGSKGVPRKNIRLLGGKPLIAWTAEAALRAQRLARTIVSTDDEEIANVAVTCGLEVPFRRPPELSDDRAPTLPVVQHALAWLEQHGDNCDAICLLQPTSPLRSAADIDACIERFDQTAADAVMSVAEVPPEYNPHWVYIADSAGMLRLSTGEASPISRRQDLPRAYHRDGSIFVTRAEVIKGGSLYGARVVGHLVDVSHHIDIDTPEDWARAEELLRMLGTTGSSSAS